MDEDIPRQIEEYWITEHLYYQIDEEIKEINNGRSIV